jgi:hypothetical protein
LIFALGLDAKAKLNVTEEMLHFKTPDETAVHVLARIEEGTRETDEFVQWDGTKWAW